MIFCKKKDKFNVKHNIYASHENFIHKYQLFRKNIIYIYEEKEKLIV